MKGTDRLRSIRAFTGLAPDLTDPHNREKPPSRTAGQRRLRRREALRGGEEQALCQYQALALVEPSGKSIAPQRSNSVRRRSSRRERL